MRRSAWIVAAAAIAIAIFVLVPRRHYQPGRLLAAHAQLGHQCAACHQPWHGPTSARCVACHGDITDVNPHGGFYAIDPDQGLIAGRVLRLSAGSDLECLSCHSEHHGAHADFARTAAFACTWCHQHPAIGAVPEHTVPVMKRDIDIRHTFALVFNHEEHRLLLSATSRGFVCASCHIVKPVAPMQPEQMAFRWSSCAGSGCHLTPQDPALGLKPAVGTEPATIPYTAKVLQINAVFAHSAGHLATPCAECHSHIAMSKAVGDDASRAIRQCFTCHAHQLAPHVAPIRATAQNVQFLPGVAAAASAPPELQTGATAAINRVVACGECHRFHIHGPMQANDFSGHPAPRSSPAVPAELHLTIYVPGLNHSGSGGRVSFHPLRLTPWPLGLLGIVAAALGGLIILRRYPAKRDLTEAVVGVAPQRTPEVPLLDDTFQTSVNHLYIVGEASGTASINLAMRSGRQVIEAVVSELKRMAPASDSAVHDVVIVGCGPAGLGATATASANHLNYVTLEKMTPASTLRAYPRAKFVQATPIDIEEYGSFFLEGDNSREELINEWVRIIDRLKLVIKDREEVVDVVRLQNLLLVRTAAGHEYRTRAVVLAIGVRGNPRHLNLPGETPGRVFYSLIETEEFKNKKILVVGGGNAAAEVVQALANSTLHNRIAYSFRSPVLTNVTRENAEKISTLQQSAAITVYPATALAQIKPGTVVLQPVKGAPNTIANGSALDGPVEFENDVIFAMIGAELPTGFLKKIGVRMGRKSHGPLTR